MNKILTPCVLAWATLCGAWGADTNETSYWPHYGRGGMIFDKNTNYVWGYHEVPHRVRWHDGFYGEELVRLELATNVTRTPWASDVPYAWVDTNRVLRVIANGKTNEVQLKCLGFGMVTNELPTIRMITTNYFTKRADVETVYEWPPNRCTCLCNDIAKLSERLRDYEWRALTNAMRTNTTYMFTH